jgi:hypothetical protein
MSGKQASEDGGLEGEELVKETCRRIRLARKHWDAHENGACRSERERALALYGRLSKEEKEGIPQVLRVWLRYRSEKYFGPERTPPGGGARKPKSARKPREPQGRQEPRASRGALPRKDDQHGKPGPGKAGSGKAGRPDA